MANAVASVERHPQFVLFLMLHLAVGVAVGAERAYLVLACHCLGILDVDAV